MRNSLVELNARERAKALLDKGDISRIAWTAG